MWEALVGKDYLSFYYSVIYKVRWSLEQIEFCFSYSVVLVVLTNNHEQRVNSESFCAICTAIMKSCTCSPECERRTVEFCGCSSICDPFVDLWPFCISWICDHFLNWPLWGRMHQVILSLCSYVKTFYSVCKWFFSEFTYSAEVFFSFFFLSLLTPPPPKSSQLV